MLIRVTGAEPNPAGGRQDRVGQVIGPPQDTHADTHTRSLSHANTLKKTFKHLTINNMFKRGIK